MHPNTDFTVDNELTNESGKLVPQAVRLFVSSTLELRDRLSTQTLELSNTRTRCDLISDELSRVRAYTPGDEIAAAIKKGAKLANKTMDRDMLRSTWLRVAFIIMIALLLIAGVLVGYLYPHPSSSTPSPTSVTIQPIDALTVNAGNVQTTFQAGDVLYVSAKVQVHFVLHHLVFSGRAHGYVDEPKPFRFSEQSIVIWEMSSGDSVSDLGVIGGGTVPVVYHVGKDLNTYGCALLNWANAQYTLGYVLQRNVAFECKVS